MPDKKLPPAVPVRDGVQFGLIENAKYYLVSADGEVLSCRSGNRICDYWKPLRPRVTKYGHSYVVITDDDGKAITKYVHRLVLLAFVPMPEPNLECRHRDGNAKNNRLSNLIWGTHAENGADMAAHGSRKGSRSGLTSFTEEIVAIIKRRLRDGEKQKDLAAEFGVHKVVISKISRGVNWKHVLID